jgi:hypothetical protein
VHGSSGGFEPGCHDFALDSVKFTFRELDDERATVRKGESQAGHFDGWIAIRFGRSTKWIVATLAAGQIGEFDFESGVEEGHLIRFMEGDTGTSADSAFRAPAFHSTASAAVRADFGAEAFHFEAVTAGNLASNAGLGSHLSEL